jgi:hypothetical protein
MALFAGLTSTVATDTCKPSPSFRHSVIPSILTADWCHGMV